MERLLAGVSFGATIGIVGMMASFSECEPGEGPIPGGLSEVGAVLEAAQPPADDPVSYARECRNELGVPEGTVIPAMNCLAGTEVPITLQVQQPDGTWTDRALRTGNDAEDLEYYEDLRRADTNLPVRNGRPVVRCANPQWLPHGGRGCWNYAHVQRIQVTPDVEVVLMCRQQHFTNPWGRERRIAEYNANPTAANFRLAFDFDDMGLIWTNTRTGRTCWFDRLGGAFGGFVPSPDHGGPPNREEALRRIADSGVHTLPPGLDEAYWNRNGANSWHPPSTVAGHNCAGCHTSGPWVVSPWVAGANVVPRNSRLARRGVPYSSVQYGDLFRNFRTWSLSTGPVTNPATNEVEPQQACTACHRIGATGNPDTGALRLDPQFNLAIAGGANAYMPDSHGATTQAEWDASYAHHVQALRCCAANPRRVGCYRQDLTQSPLRAPIAGTELPACANSR